MQKLQNNIKILLLLGCWLMQLVFTINVFAEPTEVKQPISNRLAAYATSFLTNATKPPTNIEPALLPSSLWQQPYGVELPTTGYSDAERQQNFIKALNSVLTKNSNDPKVLELAGVKAALTNPGRYVQRFNYLNRGTISDKQELFIQISFDPKAITKLLQKSSNVVWIENKPTALVWLAADNKILDETSASTVVAILKGKAQEFGLPIMLPTLDLQDLSNIKAQDLCSENTEKLYAASQRYGSAVIIVGCITSPSLLNSSWSAKWQLLQNGKNEKFVFTGNSVADLIAQALKKIPATTQNVVTPIATQTSKVGLRITNIAGLSQYNEVAQYLNNLCHITKIDLITISATEVELTINLPGGKPALLNILNAQNRLVPNTGTAPLLPPGIDLDYKWITLDLPFVDPPE